MSRNQKSSSAKHHPATAHIAKPSPYSSRQTSPDLSERQFIISDQFSNYGAYAKAYEQQSELAEILQQKLPADEKLRAKYQKAFDQNHKIIGEMAKGMIVEKILRGKIEEEKGEANLKKALHGEKFQTKFSGDKKEAFEASLNANLGVAYAAAQEDIKETRTIYYEHLNSDKTPLAELQKFIAAKSKLGNMVEFSFFMKELDEIPKNDKFCGAYHVRAQAALEANRNSEARAQSLAKVATQSLHDIRNKDSKYDRGAIENLAATLHVPFDHNKLNKPVTAEMKRALDSVGGKIQEAVGNGEIDEARLQKAAKDLQAAIGEFQERREVSATNVRSAAKKPNIEPDLPKN